MALSALEIVRIVSRSNLHSSRTEVHIDQNGIAHDGNTTVVDGVNDVFAMEVLVAGILRVDSHSGITKHGLQTSGGHYNLLVTVLHGIGELGQAAELVELVTMTGNLTQSTSFHIKVLHLYNSLGYLNTIVMLIITFIVMLIVMLIILFIAVLTYQYRKEQYAGGNTSSPDDYYGKSFPSQTCARKPPSQRR